VRARRAKTADVEAIARVCSDGWRAAYRGLLTDNEIETTIERFYDRRRIHEEVERPHGWDGWWVAEDESGVVVAAGGGGMTAPTIGEIFVLYADPERLGQGAGTAILAAITDEQRVRDAREQWVSVVEGNEIGLAFYRARGFVERGRQGPWSPDAPQRESIRMWRSL
jgi:GNAT superfamily N-acetyltransferase